jgi:hypothetical protein
MSRSTVTGSGEIGILQEGSGALESLGDNIVRGNREDVSGEIKLITGV